MKARICHWVFIVMVYAAPIVPFSTLTLRTAVWRHAPFVSSLVSIFADVRAALVRCRRLAGRGASGEKGTDNQEPANKNNTMEHWYKEHINVSI